MLLPTQCPLRIDYFIILGSSSFTIAFKGSEKNPPAIEIHTKKQEELGLVVHIGTCIPLRLRQADLEFQVTWTAEKGHSSQNRVGEKKHGGRNEWRREVGISKWIR